MAQIAVLGIDSRLDGPVNNLGIHIVNISGCRPGRSVFGINVLRRESTGSIPAGRDIGRRARQADTRAKGAGII
ncbi:hypothetical protein HYQ46_012936 [Verticillium longisporum]|nr:hypothetical protein HYQ46_012936 [Verticillium longisporum]